MYILWEDFQGAKNVNNNEAHSGEVWQDLLQIQMKIRGATHQHLGRGKTSFSIPDELLSSDDEDMLHAGEYATYDFEAILHKEDASHVEFSSSSDVLVYDYNGELCTK